MDMLELRGVTKTYGTGASAVQALRGVDLTVAAGSMVAVMGPSGSGKSTLLTIAGSLDDPASGEILVDGVPLTGMPRNAKARLRRRMIGYVFQDFNLLAGLTAAENVALPLELDGVSARKARVTALRTLDGLGLRERAGQFPDELSGGERQRVAIARALVGDRRLLLADEPSGALDSANAQEVMRLLHEACQRGVAAVVVTHDEQMASWADQVVRLRDGRVVDQAGQAGRLRDVEAMDQAGQAGRPRDVEAMDQAGQAGRPRDRWAVDQSGQPAGLGSLPPSGQVR